MKLLRSPQRPKTHKTRNLNETRFRATYARASGEPIKGAAEAGFVRHARRVAALAKAAFNVAPSQERRSGRMS
eukprot:3000073-Pleurochrysis_carterae.AAC.1